MKILNSYNTDVIMTVLRNGYSNMHMHALWPLALTVYSAIYITTYLHALHLSCCEHTTAQAKGEPSLQRKNKNSHDMTISPLFKKLSAALVVVI